MSSLPRTNNRPGRKSAEEQGDTRADIKQTAFTLFGRFGYDGVSLLTVAKAAGITKAAVYWHYENKDALYLDCLGELHALYGHYVFEPMLNEQDPMQQALHLFIGMRRLLDDVRISEGIAGYWLDPSGSDLPQARNLQSSFETKARQQIEKVLRALIASEELGKKGGHEDLAEAILVIIEAIVLPLQSQDTARANKIVHALARTLFKAYAPDPATVEWALEQIESGFAPE